MTGQGQIGADRVIVVDQQRRLLRWSGINNDVDLRADFLQNLALIGVQGVLIVIASLDVNIGRGEFEKTCRAHLRKNCDQINALQCGNDLRARSAARVAEDTEFKFLLEDTQRMKDRIAATQEEGGEADVPQMQSVMSWVR